MKRSPTSANTKHASKQKESQARSLQWVWRKVDGTRSYDIVADDTERTTICSGVRRVKHARLLAVAPELLEALQLMSDHHNDMSKSNPGFMGKLCLQDYALWNKALYEMERVLKKVNLSPAEVMSNASR